MKKGFTLIELLAVIVILAIIALIAVPIILEVITNTKEETIIRSTENYLKAVELSITTASLDDNVKEINGVYEIKNNGKEIQKGEEEPIKVNFDGEGLESGIILIKDSKVKRVKNAKIGSLVYVKSFRGDTIIFNEEPEDVVLKTGQNFNAIIKTLVTGESSSFKTEDTKVKSIEFLSYGSLPEGYTLSELQELESVNVSVNNDNKIMAYYDGVENVFIYSEGLINFNETSNNLFQGFKDMESIKFNEIDTSQVTGMNYMFMNCNNLKSIDISNFDTSQVTTMTYMFNGCSNLTNLDLSKFDTSQVTNMAYMFNGCSNLTNLDLKDFNTSQVTTMERMFTNCTNLTTINVSKFDTSKVEYMQSMFSGCSNLTTLDLSNFDTNLVTTMEKMFYSSKKLKCIKVGENWTKENIVITNMFTSCGVSSVTKDSCPK